MVKKIQSLTKEEADKIIQGILARPIGLDDEKVEEDEHIEAEEAFNPEESTDFLEGEDEFNPSKK